MTRVLAQAAYLERLLLLLLRGHRLVSLGTEVVQQLDVSQIEHSILCMAGSRALSHRREAVTFRAALENGGSRGDSQRRTISPLAMTAVRGDGCVRTRPGQTATFAVFALTMRGRAGNTGRPRFVTLHVSSLTSQTAGSRFLVGSSRHCMFKVLSRLLAHVR